MSFTPLDIPAGVIKTRSGEGAAGRWSDANNIRFVAGKPVKRAGVQRLNSTLMQGVARGMKAWNKINGLPLYAVGTNSKLYGSITGEDVINITPLRPVYQWVSALSSTLNFGAVSVHQPGHGFALGQQFVIYGNSYKGGSQIAGLLLNGVWAVVAVTDADNFVIYPTAAHGLLGADPFVTTAASAVVLVNHPGHGRATGDTAWYSGASAVGGITLDGDYQITVLNTNQYNVTAATPAGAGATGGGTVAYKYGLPANATVAAGGGTVPYNMALTDPFQVTAGSAVITVTHPGHGAKVGDTVSVSGAAAVGGITPSGDYVVVSGGLDTYTIAHGSLALANAVGGGSAVLIDYEMSPGPATKVTSHRAFGMGPLGAGPFGQSLPADGSTYFDPRTWSMGNIGEDGMMCPLGGSIYYWDSSAAGRAEVIPEAPTSLRYAFMTDERFLTALGINGDPMAIGWSSQDSLGDWIPSPTNTANNSRRVREGSALMAGTPVGGGVNLLWTDTAIYVHQFTGSKFVYETRLDMTDAGLLAPHAFARTPKGVLWMSQNRFKMWNGSTADVPNSGDVETWVFLNIDPNQHSKCFGQYDSVNNSVDFYFVPLGAAEPSRYVTVCLDDWSWVPGEQTRTTGSAFQSGLKNPYRVVDGIVYQHEIGLDDDGAAAPFSLTLAPYALEDGNSELLGFDPDFIRQVGPITLEVRTYDRDIRVVQDFETALIEVDDEITDLRSEGRHVSLTFSQSLIGGDFAMDTPKIDVKARGKRR